MATSLALTNPFVNFKVKINYFNEFIYFICLNEECLKFAYANNFITWLKPKHIKNEYISMLLFYSNLNTKKTVNGIISLLL